MKDQRSLAANCLLLLHPELSCHGITLVVVFSCGAAGFAGAPAPQSQVTVPRGLYVESTVSRGTVGDKEWNTVG